MKKKLLFVIPALVLALTFPLSACDTDSDNNFGNPVIDNVTPEITSPVIIGSSTSNNTPPKETDNDTPPTDEDDDTQTTPTDEDGDKQTTPKDKDGDTQTPPKNEVIDWETSEIFVENTPDYEFDFSKKDTNFSYEIGSDENEEIFARILSGEEDYRDYFIWFSRNPDYIYRYNEERYKIVCEIIQKGACSQELQNKYYGLFSSDTNYHYVSSHGITTESYLICLNNDWSINYIQKVTSYAIQCDAFERWHYSLGGYTLGGYQAKEINSEIKQYDEFIDPQYDNGQLIGYNVTFTSLLLEVDMGDGKTADCSVDATYKSEITTEFVWDGQKQQHGKVTYLANCRVTADFNNVYSGGREIFDRILIFTTHDGTWDLFKVWEQYREEALTPSLNLYEGKNEQKVYQLA